MISKQEGGPGRGRLLLPGEQGDWAARNLIPLPPRLFMAPLSRRRAPSPGVRGSGAPGGPAWSKRGAETAPNKGSSFEYWAHLWRVIGPNGLVASLFFKTYAK